MKFTLKYYYWSFVHNCIAHPLLFITFDSKLADSFHNWSADKWSRYFERD